MLLLSFSDDSLVLYIGRIRSDISVVDWKIGGRRAIIEHRVMWDETI